jgi:hypothetical protein
VRYSAVKESCDRNSITLVLACWIPQCYTYLLTYLFTYLLTYLLTYVLTYLLQGEEPFWSRFSDTKEIPRILWNLHFMEASLSHSQVPATCPYTEPDRPSTYPHVPLTENPS